MRRWTPNDVADRVEHLSAPTAQVGSAVTCRHERRRRAASGPARRREAADLRQLARLAVPPHLGTGRREPRSSGRFAWAPTSSVIVTTTDQAINAAHTSRWLIPVRNVSCSIRLTAASPSARMASSRSGPRRHGRRAPHHRPPERCDHDRRRRRSRRPSVDHLVRLVGCVEPVNRRQHQGDGRHDEGGRHEPRPACRAGQEDGQRGEPTRSRREGGVHHPAVWAQRVLTQSALDRRDPGADQVQGDHAGHSGSQ